MTLTAVIAAAVDMKPVFSGVIEAVREKEKVFKFELF